MKHADKEIETFLSLHETLGNDSFASDIQALEVESVGWVYLSEGAYLNEGSDWSSVILAVRHSTSQHERVQRPLAALI